tara:strand:+ start:2183 stop:3343 length:1161 start_codon:yes stop_codon:yes gene_type:complete
MTVTVTQPTINVREELADLRKPSGIAGEAMLRAETPQEQFQLINAGRKNLLYNGAMMINQRGTQSGITSTKYTLDRWILGDGTNGAFQVSQSSNVPDGFQNAWLFETTTADTDLSSGTQYVNFFQKLEGQDVKQLAYGTPSAKATTLSFWVKSSKAGQFASELEISGGVNVQPWTVNKVDTWEYKTVTFAGNTSTAITPTTSIGMWVTVCWMAAGAGISGPNFQSGWRALNQTERLPEGIPNIADSTSNIMRFTGVQLEVGKVATPFEHRSYGEELALCQRYAFVVNGDADDGIGFGTAKTSTQAIIYVNFTCVMRSNPSLVVDNPQIRVDSLGTLQSNTVDGSLQISNSTAAGAHIKAEGFSGLDSSMSFPAKIVSGAITFDAEL